MLIGLVGWLVELVVCVAVYWLMVWSLFDRLRDSLLVPRSFDWVVCCSVSCFFFLLLCVDSLLGLRIVWRIERVVA